MKLSNMTNFSRKSRGFTFTEILIVLAIIAGVTVLVLSQADSAVSSGEVSRAAGDVRTLVTAAGQFRALRSTYTGITDEELINLGLLPDGMINGDNLVGPYNDGSSDTAYQLSSLNSGRDFKVMADFGADVESPVLIQLHEAFGGFTDSCLTVAADIADGATTACTVTTSAALTTAGDAQYWGHQFN